MFLVFNKDKIMAFVVACATVFALFLMTTFFAKTPENAIPTSAITFKENYHVDNNGVQQKQ